MKRLSLLLAVILVITSISVPAFAQEAADPAIQESASGFFFIEAEGERPRLSAKDQNLFMQIDGEWYKDLNKNGELDAYEDWHLSSQERAENLLSLMNINEKAGTLGFGGISGSNGIVVTKLGDGEVTNMFGQKATVINPDNASLSSDGSEFMVTFDEVQLPSMRYQAQTLGMSTYIGAMTGTPQDQLIVANYMQGIQEETRLGIPCVISGDRSYNTWGGMVDMPHYALGVARDPELLYNLASEYAKESVAIGYQQVFHGYGNEIGSFYGDDPNYIAEMAATETRAYQDNGFSAHSKHFIARGGRNSYAAAKSPADLIDSWMIGWKAVVDEGTDYIMTNNAVARTDGLIGFMDKTTYDILRNDLGYDGVICLDWPMGPASIMSQTGITADGIDVSTLTLGERYVLILNVGVDMFSCGYAAPGLDYEAIGSEMVYFPDILIAEIEAGKYTEEEMDVHVLRVLRNKFDLGIVDNPYRDWGEALELIGSDEYKAEQFIPNDTIEVNKARRDEITAMEEEVVVKSTILLKNDGVLPLTADAKVYFDGNVTDNQNLVANSIGEKAELVEDMAEATVAIYHASSFDDAYELFIEDAADAGVPTLVIFEGTNSSEPSLSMFVDADALMMQTYNNTPDHGSSFGDYYRYASPWVTAQMLFGEKEPAGKTLFELGYTADAKTLSWGELQDDIGVTDQVRLYMAMLAKRNPAIEMPNNLGDVIVTDSFGMNYSDAADIQLSLLTVPRTVVTEEVEGSSGVSTQTSVYSITPKAGEPFTISFVAENVGAGDGLITVPVLDNGTVIAEKVVGVTADQFRVISVDIVLEAGTHEITVGDMTATITVE